MTGDGRTKASSEDSMMARVGRTDEGSELGRLYEAMKILTVPCEVGVGLQGSFLEGLHRRSKVEGESYETSA